LLDALIAVFSDYGYIAVFAMLLLCGFGLPVPEDITLVAGGVITGLACPESERFLTSLKTCPGIHLMMLVSMAGVLIGDLTMVTLGRVLGQRVMRLPWFRRLFSEPRRAAVEDRVQRHGCWIVFAARFMPGLRSPIFAVTGMTRRVSYLRFVLTDGVAAIISVPLWVYLGFLGAQNRTALIHWTKTGRAASFIVLGIVLFIFFVVLFIRRRQR
jgi:membrane protein DedA with SNARE-associated domain